MGFETLYMEMNVTKAEFIKMMKPIAKKFDTQNKMDRMMAQKLVTIICENGFKYEAKIVDWDIATGNAIIRNLIDEEVKELEKRGFAMNRDAQGRAYEIRQAWIYDMKESQVIHA